MTKYYAGPWQWNSSATNPHYHAPAGSFALICLRNMETQSAANHAGGVGNGFFCTPDDVDLGSDYSLLGNGYITEVTTNNTIRSAWESLYGVRPQGDKLIDYLSYTLGDGSDPDGATGPKPIMPGVAPQGEAVIELAGHSVVYRRTLNPISGNTPHEKKCRDRIQKDLADIAETDEPLFRKCLGRTKEKCGLRWDDDNESWALSAKTKNKGKGSNGKTIAEKPATTYTESWPTTGAITASQDRSWSYLTGWQSGGMSVDTGELENTGSNGQRYFMMNSALSGTDVYAQCEYRSFQGVAEGQSGGCICRKDSTVGTITFYILSTYKSGSTTYHYTQKRVSGTLTDLTFGSGYTASVGDVDKLECNGSSIKSYKNGVQRNSNTDTSISTGTYCGMNSYGGVDYGFVTDNWECGDLGGGGGVVIPVFMNQYRQRWGK